MCAGRSTSLDRRRGSAQELNIMDACVYHVLISTGLRGTRLLICQVGILNSFLMKSSLAIWPFFVTCRPAIMIITAFEPDGNVF